MVGGRLTTLCWAGLAVGGLICTGTAACSAGLKVGVKVGKGVRVRTRVGGGSIFGRKTVQASPIENSPMRSQPLKRLFRGVVAGEMK
jgi:hypothetical protein